MKKKTTSEVKETSQDYKAFAFGKTNWLLMVVSLACILIGFLLMTGSSSGEQFNPDIFSTRRITVGPMIALFGFLFMIVAIMWPNKKGE
ncbi:MAG: DUF3098 domain-containing protein [Bacteroidota bacterium]|nr:DUF3098 domain-containing protein [Bacteroidota bacterium]